MANEAFREAAWKVIERAELTETDVIVWENGHIVRISPNEARERLHQTTHQSAQ